MAEPLIIEKMRDAFEREAERWTREWRLDGMKGWLYRRNDDGDDILMATLENVNSWDADNALIEAKERAGRRAELRAAADCFCDPVVKSALLWAAKEGEKP